MVASRFKLFGLEERFGMSRKNFTTATIVARFKHCRGKCESCGVVLKPGAYHCDHANPDGLTGLPTFDNAKILCRQCHTEKTRADVADIAGAKRKEARNIGAVNPAGNIKSAGFAKSERPERRASQPSKLDSLPPRRALYR